KKPVNFSELDVINEEDEQLGFADLLPSRNTAEMAGPEAEYLRSLLLEEVEEAIAELPSEQREVFIEHELEGRSFIEMAAAQGVSLNTLLARKRYAVLHLRKRLRDVYEELGRE